MSSDFDKDDFARLLALEHAFSALALISASNFAYHTDTKPSEAVKHFRDAIEGSLYDVNDRPKEVRDLMKSHLSRMFNHIEGMAKHADRNE